MTYKGSCLCQSVQFEIRGALTGIGYCHCSKCRKVSGTGSNAVAYASPEHLAWTSGKEYIKKFQFPDGWSSTFCSNCGSPLPQTYPDQPLCYIPAGVLDSDPGPEIIGHMFVGSKASWDSIADDSPQFENGIG